MDGVLILVPGSDLQPVSCVPVEISKFGWGVSGSAEKKDLKDIKTGPHITSVKAHCALMIYCAL